jgi:hypothetical protein
VRRRLDGPVRLHDPAVRTDQIRDALGPAGLRRIQRAVGLADRLLGIAQQPERVLELLGERAVRTDIVEARAEDDSILGFEVADSITESVALLRSTRGVGGGIEPQHDVLAGEVGELHARAVVGRDIEVGGEIAW